MAVRMGQALIHLLEGAAGGEPVLATAKARLISVIILIMAVTFLEHIVEWKNPFDLLMFGVAIAVVALILYLRFGQAPSLAGNFYLIRRYGRWLVWATE